MIPKQYRLKNAKAFEATYKNRNIKSNDFFCIHFGKLKKDFQFKTRIAFVVSKKVHKRAVVRNRIKRLMRESVRLMIKNSKTQNINKYMSIICVAKTKSIGASFETVNTSLQNILS